MAGSERFWAEFNGAGERIVFQRIASDGVVNEVPEGGMPADASDLVGGFGFDPTKENNGQGNNGQGNDQKEDG